MGGGRDERPLAAPVLNDGNGQRRALHGVGAGAQLVKEQQAVLVRLPQNLHGVGHMRRESRKALLNALLVAHVRQHAVKHPQPAPVVGGDLQPALRHERQQADGFQGHGLAAGVGAGDDQSVILIPQLQRNGHRLGLIQQRMPCPPQHDAALSGEKGHGGVHPVAKLRPCENDVQMHQNVIVIENVHHLRRALAGEDAQNAVYLLFLPCLQFLQLVVGLYHAHWLHEKRRSRGGDVVDEAGDAPLALRLHRHHEPPVPLGDERLLQDLGVGGGGDNALQNLPPLAGGQPHFAPDVGKLGAGAVGNGLLVQNCPVNFILQKFIGMQGGKQVIQHGFLPLPILVVLRYPSGGRQQVCHVQQLAGVQHAAVVGAVQRPRHVLHARKAGAAHKPQPLPRALGFRLQMQRLLQVAHRHKAAAFFLGRIAHRQRRQHGKHRRQLQRPYGFFK